MLDLLEAPGPFAQVPEGSRRCSRCGEIKPLEEFPMKIKARGLRRVWCRDCCRAYGREHYRKNKPMYLAKNARRRALIRPQVRAGIDTYLRSHPCVDCGCSEITVLEFDHRDPAEKDFAVGELARWAEWSRVLHEIKKCDIRCANCHRRRTAAQFVWAKAVGVMIDIADVRPGKAGRYATIEDARQGLLLSTEVHGLRRCSRCGKLQPIWDFSFRRIRLGLRGYYCHSCRVAYRRDHYERNKPDYMRRAKTEARLKKQDILLCLHEYLRAHPCVDCGETDIAVLDFDHVDRATKTMAVAQMIPRRSWKTILIEIEKCAVRCANCHRRRTARQQRWKVRLAERPTRYRRISPTRE